jgi:hypothetical protein
VRRGRLSIRETPGAFGHASPRSRNPVHARELPVFANYFNPLFPAYSLAGDSLYKSTVRSDEPSLADAATVQATDARQEAPMRKEAYA